MRYLCVMFPRHILWVAFIALLFASCEKKIDFPLKEADGLLSVDASIESGQVPMVVLTRSINFFSNVTPRILSDAMVRNATVTIKEGNTAIPLKKMEIPFPGNLSYVYYTYDTTGADPVIRGAEGKRYELNIQWEGRTYTANTTIPMLKKTIDSLWWEKAPLSEDTSNKIVLRGLFVDPPAFGDYVRYFTKVNQEPFYPGSNSAFDDLLVNGTTYEVEIPRSLDRNTRENFEDRPTFRRGDTITVKFSNIDKATFEFWRTVEFSYRAAGNPFSSPVKILGNISNGALGYFGGYANQFKSIIIPPL
ncbi:MAG: DUF4249 family protein [Bacteroidetes bacterium]|nr:DUF4249 family protein [Bacteroidota bacterium]